MLTWSQHVTTKDPGKQHFSQLLLGTHTHPTVPGWAYHWPSLLPLPCLGHAEVWRQRPAE